MDDATIVFNNIKDMERYIEQWWKRDLIKFPFSSYLLLLVSSAYYALIFFCPLQNVAYFQR